VYILYTHGRPNKGGPAAAARVAEKVRPRVHVWGAEETDSYG